jgi:hypothetical protein
MVPQSIEIFVRSANLVGTHAMSTAEHAEERGGKLKHRVPAFFLFCLCVSRRGDRPPPWISLFLVVGRAAAELARGFPIFRPDLPAPTAGLLQPQQSNTRAFNNQTLIFT